MWHTIWRCIKGVFDFINTYFKVVVLLLVVFFFIGIAGDDMEQEEPNLAKLYLNFPIYESESFRTQVESIMKNKHIKGVLLLIDSPGGAVGASIEIADMIKELSEQMPVIAYTQSLMASGSYYAGMYAQSIYANRGALVGSIGVIFATPNLSGAMERLGIAMQGASAGEYKEIGTMTRQWRAKEQQFIQELTNEQYKMFYTDVLAARAGRLKTTNPSEFADGKILSAAHAKELGLIDHVGSMNDAINALKSASGVTEPIWLKKDKMEAFMDSIMDKAATKITAPLTQSLIWAM